MNRVPPYGIRPWVQANPVTLRNGYSANLQIVRDIIQLTETKSNFP